MEKNTLSSSAGSMAHFAHLPELPSSRLGSPEVVRVCDRMRQALDNVEELSEFCWFAREYPRCYRFHMDGAEFRLGSIHSLMAGLRTHLENQVKMDDPNTFECGVSDLKAQQVYWDFESFLSEISISLDLLARVVGPAFKEESPPSFNRLCKWQQSHPIIDLFRRAQTRSVSRMKDYRDCFTHYTPVDTLLMVVLRQYKDRWEVRAKLPTNPNVRDILGFRFSRRTELLRYALTVQDEMAKFDRAVARLLWRLYSQDQFPVRKEHLFFVGRRDKER